VHEDAVISARRMYSFAVGGETVNVLLGDFSLTLGKRVVSGRDAVMWIAERRLAGRTLRDIETYVEGDARIVEADGTVVKDARIFDVSRHQGAIRARVGLHHDRALVSFPLYARAEEMRKKIAAQAETQPKPPPLVRAQPTTPATTTAPAPPAGLHRPVSFRADKYTSEEVPDPKDPKLKRRITIAKGNVYFSQGHPDEELFLEMQAQAAVVYTAPGAAAPGPGPEQILAAYLEGDVVMRRGERSLMGQRLYYDFVAGRALILEPVLRTVQEQRNIPVYIRGREARQLAAYQRPGELRVRGYRWHFKDALVTTSDFYTPEWSIAAKRAELEDTTIYDEEGRRLSERRWRTKLVNTTFRLGEVPLLWAPYTVGDAEEGHTALRSLQGGRHGRFGWGVESEWFLFRLLGVHPPEGFKGRLEADWYERGVLVGPTVTYRREDYSGYALAYGVLDNEQQDDFGTDRQNISAPRERGRLLWRHKHFLPRDWEVQLETSYLCDRNFLEEFFPREFWADKEQENLIYAKKQRENWAFTVLAKWRLNDFLTQTEAYPDLAGYLIGQSLWEDRLTLHTEGRLGVVRFRPDEMLDVASSGPVVRADLRQEVDVPLAFGPVKLLPYVVGRLTYWEDSPEEGGLIRPWAQVGATATMHIWRLYNQVESRTWDLHRLKHVITPYAALFASCTDVEPDRLYPFNPGIEVPVQRLGGGTVGVRQLWQTKRGPAGDQHTVDWLRLDVSASCFDDADTMLPADGRFLLSRPEYSFPRNAINFDGVWNVSDSTTVLAGANYDTDSGKLGRGNIGVAVSRDPRLRYYAGLRCIEALDSSVGTFGLFYRINRKYSLNFFQQYDFDLEGGRNQATSVTIVRKFPRLYTAVTFVYDRTQNDVGVVFSIWPEGIPEVNIGGSRLSLLSAVFAED